MINGWALLAALVWVAVGVVIGLMTAALLVAAREDAPMDGADAEDGDD